jgi:hypothetical protein
MNVVKTGHGKVIVVLSAVVVILGGGYYLFIANGGANNPFARTDSALRDFEEAWTHLSDTEDDDQDGLNNWFEDHYQTDKGASDTDGDGLSDYVEAAVLRTDPLTPDTGGSGTSDGDGDFDDDGLANIDEVGNGLNPLLADSDFDGLNDYDETNTYRTDPVGSDTDGDGAGDGWEIEHGFDPLAPASSFDVQESAASESTGVRASVRVALASTQAETLHVDEVTSHYFLNEDLPGYLAPAYDFSVSGEFDSAEISFELRADLLTAPGVVPTIYRFDPDSGSLEEQTTKLDGDTAKATVEHFSQYTLVDKNAFDRQYTAPTLGDADFDGFPDSEDPRPLVWDVSDRDLAMFAGIAYSSFVSHDLSQLSEEQLVEIDDQFDGAPGVTTKELRGWKVVDHASSFISGFAATAYKNGDNIVIAFRGTEVPDLRDWVVDVSAFVLGWALQDEDAKSFAERVATKYQGKTFYVAGHSLGGRLAYKAGSAIISAVTRIATFNGLGLDPRDADGERLSKEAELIADFSVEGDAVYGLNLLEIRPQHYGVNHEFENRNPDDDLMVSKHSLYTFVVELEPKGRGAQASAPPETSEPSVPSSPPSSLEPTQPSATGTAGMPTSGFSIEGAWKSIGDSGFGQAQPGATVTFDGVNCNFYSPKDTYAFYRDGEGWRLDLTSLIFAQNLSFTVTVDDQDHIEIRGSSTVTVLERVRNAASSGSGGATGGEGFSIVGKWKSVGAEGFGQAQPGAVVVFDGGNCNFYSPQDSYDFYLEDGVYYLDVISMWFEEFKTYAVTVVNQDQIEIQTGSTTTVLKRVG